MLLSFSSSDAESEDGSSESRSVSLIDGLQGLRSDSWMCT